MGSTISYRGILAGAILSTAWLCVLSVPAVAQFTATCSQDQGFNVVWGKCTGSVAQQGSYALVDATQFTGDICGKISAILSQYVNAGVAGIVIDARGVSPEMPQNCGTNPWSGLTFSTDLANTVLLPPGNITICTTWVLPQDTQLIGAGPTTTILQPAKTGNSSCSGGFTGTDLIDMGSLSICTNGTSDDCQHVTIEHLGLNGLSVSNLNGIVNKNSQELSRVNDVFLDNITGIGLDVEMLKGSNSGPYSNITYSGTGKCLVINGAYTRGVHGLNCATSGSSQSAAIYLDGFNNSLEDVFITGGASQDGILVGSQASSSNFVAGNVLFNISSASSLSHLIHICGASASGGCPGTNAADISDVSIMAASSAGGTTVQDDLGGAQLTDSTVAFYVIGQPVYGGGNPIGYSRFLTSTASGSDSKAPTWIVGPIAPTGTCLPGSLYSRTGSSSGATLYGCSGITSSWSGLE
jgi:hypothetical protein